MVEASAEPRDGTTGCSRFAVAEQLHVSELACFWANPPAVLCSRGYQATWRRSAHMRIRDMIIKDAEPPQPVRAPPGCPGADFTCTSTTTWTTWRRVLRRTEGAAGSSLDAVFSMEGTVADLAASPSLPTGTAAGSMDESHALALGPDRPKGFGRVRCLGAHGRGDGHVQQIAHSVGRFIAGRDRPVVDYIRHNGSRSCVFRQPAAAAAATHAALRVGRREPTGGLRFAGHWPKYSHRPGTAGLSGSITEPQSCR